MVLVDEKIKIGAVIEINRMLKSVRHCNHLEITYYPRGRVFAYRFGEKIIHSQGTIERFVKLLGYGSLREFNLKHQNRLKVEGDVYKMWFYLVEFDKESVIFEL